MEALIALVIIALLAGLLYPVLAAAKLRVLAVSSIHRMRQIHMAIEVYRNEYDGTDVFDSHQSFYTLGLPVSPWPGYVQLQGVAPSTWESPCAGSGPRDSVICRTAYLPGACGYVSYVAGLYYPFLIDRLPWEGNGNRIEYHDYIPTYRQNIVLLVDPYCNPVGTNMSAPLVRKRGIALLLSGQAVNRYATGNASRLQWYSEPPE